MPSLQEQLVRAEARLRAKAKKAIDEKKAARGAAQDVRDAKQKIDDSRAFALGRGILRAELSEDELLIIGQILDRSLTSERDRYTLSDLLPAGPKPPELRQAGK